MNPPSVPASAYGQVVGSPDQQAPSHPQNQQHPLAPAPSGPDLDEIVDRVVAKIEQRVVDELERRGRRYTPGVF